MENLDTGITQELGYVHFYWSITPPVYTLNFLRANAFLVLLNILYVGLVFSDIISFPLATGDQIGE